MIRECQVGREFRKEVAQKAVLEEMVAGMHIVICGGPGLFIEEHKVKEKCSLIKIIEDLFLDVIWDLSIAGIDNPPPDDLDLMGRRNLHRECVQGCPNELLDVDAPPCSSG